ncbi:hypothetical protein RRG08_018785 [Elysia crispata]|uniref:Uncharacterized protein n=1 Tax=Elysia crispata TaxID=231223 RepID=A0AAE1B6V9_9GAST|nr:hypothetical protein RRG08_018785 [Elysia crispata]
MTPGRGGNILTPELSGSLGSPNLLQVTLYITTSLIIKSLTSNGASLLELDGVEKSHTPDLTAASWVATAASLNNVDL